MVPKTLTTDKFKISFLVGLLVSTAVSPMSKITRDAPAALIRFMIWPRCCTDLSGLSGLVVISLSLVRSMLSAASSCSRSATDKTYSLKMHSQPYASEPRIWSSSPAVYFNVKVLDNPISVAVSLNRLCDYELNSIKNILYPSYWYFLSDGRWSKV